MEIKKILYILSGNISTTPRALQSIITAQKYYKVDILGVERNTIWNKIDKELVKEYQLNYKTVSLSKKTLFSWLFSSIIHRLSNKLYLFLKHNRKITSYASSKASVLLINELKEYGNEYSLIIGHSFGSLYPAYKFAKKTNTKFTFDIEDYHPGEIVPTDAEDEKARRIFLMQNILPKASYITYASPLIGKHSLELLNNYPENKHQLINNCFSQTEFQFTENNSEKIKFVWFSQNISAGRGLELVVPALAKFKDKIELHLIGNLYQDFNDNFLSKYSDFIKITPPLPQKELNLKLSEFDVGLAIELNTADFNRQICLTNKIWAYTQSGLYVLATDTLAQIIFLEEYKNIGLVSEQNKDNFTISIEKIINNIKEIRINKQNRFNYAQKLSWENENKKLNEIWNSIL